MRVILFGSNGWLGKSVTSLLDGRFDVWGFDRSNAGDADNAFEGDVRNRGDVRRFFDRIGDCGDDVLIHTASVIHPRIRVKELYDVNVSGLGRIIETFANQGGKRVVYISSNSPFGAFKDDRVLDEDAPYHPYLHYGKSKRMAEETILGSSLTSIIFRVPWFYGDHMPDRQVGFYNMIRRGRFPVFGSGENVRSVVNVQDIARAIETVIREYDWSDNRQYWLSTSSRSMKAMVTSIREILVAEGVPVERSSGCVLIPGVVSDACRVADHVLQAVGLYQTQLHVMGELNLNIQCSAARFERDFSFEFSSFEQGTRDAIAGIKAMGWPGPILENVREQDLQ